MDSMKVSVARRTVRIDGARYELAAVCIDGEDYQATWQCPICSCGEASHVMYPRPTAALEWAEGCAIHHGQEVHCSPQIEGSLLPLTA